MDGISEIDWARLAAYVDGEGTITITRSKSVGKRGRSEGYVVYRLRVQLSNTDKRLLNWARNLFGGYIYPQKEERPNRKPIFEWEVNGPGAYKIIVGIRKYQIIKGEQTDVAIPFWMQCGRWTRRMYRRPDWMKRKQEKFYQEMKKLNKRGVEREEVTAPSLTSLERTKNESNNRK